MRLAEKASKGVVKEVRQREGANHMTPRRPGRDTVSRQIRHRRRGGEHAGKQAKVEHLVEHLDDTPPREV